MLTHDVQPPGSSLHDEVAAARRSARLSSGVSVAALLLALFALLPDSRPSRTASLRADTPGEKALDPDREYVKLREIAIFQDQIADFAVGTSELADRSVTQPKLAAGAVGADQIADGSIGFDKLSADAVADIASSVGIAGANILGEVDERGNAVGPNADGFTSERSRIGIYQLRFTTAFAKVPVVVVSARGPAMCYCPKDQITRQGAEIHCMAALLSATQSLVSMGFSFYAGSMSK